MSLLSEFAGIAARDGRAALVTVSAGGEVGATLWTERSATREVGETSLSIMAEVVAVRNGRSGGRLSDSAGRIHEVGA